jgi:hypothetical protein
VRSCGCARPEGDGVEHEPLAQRARHSLRTTLPSASVRTSSRVDLGVAAWLPSQEPAAEAERLRQGSRPPASPPTRAVELLVVSQLDEVCRGEVVVRGAQINHGSPPRNAFVIVKRRSRGTPPAGGRLDPTAARTADASSPSGCTARRPSQGGCGLTSCLLCGRRAPVRASRSAA